MKINMQNKVPQLQCPSCHSYKVNDKRKNKLIIFGAGFFLFFIGILIPFFGWLIMMPAGLLMMIVSPFIPNKNEGVCRNCRFMFEIKP